MYGILCVNSYGIDTSKHCGAECLVIQNSTTESEISMNKWQHNVLTTLFVLSSYYEKVKIIQLNYNYNSFSFY